DARADQEHAAREPGLKRGGTAKERGWISRYLLQPAGADWNGNELGADRPTAWLRANVSPLWADKGILRQGMGVAGWGAGRCAIRSNARYWHKADISRLSFNVRFRG